MLLFTIPLGGLLFMMGNHSRSESLFYYFRLEDQVPENHLLRLIDRHKLPSLSCALAQGYLLSSPLSTQDFTELLKSGNTRF